MNLFKIYILIIIIIEIGILLYRWNILPTWFSMSSLPMLIIMVISVLFWKQNIEKIEVETR